MNGGLALRLTAPDAEKKVPHLANDPLLVRLGVGSLPLRELDSLFAGRLPETYSAVHDLWKARVVELLNRADDPDVAVSATGTADTLDLARADTGGTWRLSRFAYAHRDDGTLRLESPRATKMVTLLTARAAGLLVDLLRPCALHELQRRLDWLPDGDAIDDLVFLLRLGAVIEPCDGDGNLAEDVRPELMQWEFHDLLFHNRSRQGRHDAPLGAQFRFHDKLSPQPVVKPNRWASRALPLYRPTAMSIAAADPPFSVVLESRRSIRAHSDVRPITLDQVGDFLFRAARNRFRYMTSLGEFVSRPYPCGGASYEAEVYLTANRCLGLERGFYYYDPEAHTLSLVETANADTEGLLDDAFVSCAGICRPQVLLTIASRFHRVAWKYSGMAYATQLKNVGALYQTFYLVATAMNLAGCGLGLGNVHRFARLTGISFLEEGSIGEFMLGNPA